MQVASTSLRTIAPLVAKAELAEIAGSTTKEVVTILTHNTKEALTDIVHTVAEQTAVGTESAKMLVGTFAEGTAQILQKEATNAGAMQKHLTAMEQNQEQELEKKNILSF